MQLVSLPISENVGAPVTGHEPIGPHLAAVLRDLSLLPIDLQRTATAAAAEGLARSLDLGTDTYRFQAGLVAQLRECMAELAAKAPAKVEGDSVDELTAVRAARRRAAASGS